MIYVICGPTASGKSQLAERLSRKLKAPVINGDVFQMYKEMNIGTAKPSIDEIEDGNHFLFNEKSVEDNITIFDYQIIFRKCVDQLLTKYQNLIVVGGAGLYIKSAIYDYNFSENNSFELDKKYKDLSNQELYNLLLSIDPVSANKTHPNNRKRVERALVICFSSDKKKSEIEQMQKHICLYETRFIGLNIEREIVYNNINKRVDLMFDLGLENEVRNLFKNHSTELIAFQAIGYKEFLNVNISIDEIKELIKKNTRNYAKRQMTFFKHQFESIEWFDTVEEAYSHIN